MGGQDSTANGNHHPPTALNFDVVKAEELIVGSCMRSPEDVLKAKEAGADFIFSLQDEADLKKLNIDLDAIGDACRSSGLRFISFATNETDEEKLRKDLPKAVAAYAAAQQHNSVGYLHCNAGRQRAPTVALAYYYWLGGQQLNEALQTITNARESQPKVHVVRGATWDLLAELGFSSDEVKARVLSDDGSGDFLEEERSAIVKKLTASDAA